MNRVRILIGSDNVRELVSRDGYNLDPTCLFVDKTKFIVDFLNLSDTRADSVIDATAKAVLITRPRRWGKTTILSMLQHFFAREVGGLPTANLFDGLYIKNQPDFKEQGQWPVIFISFKDLQDDDFDNVLQTIAEKIAEVFTQHHYLLQALKNGHGGFAGFDPEFANSFIKKFIRIINQESQKSELANSLKFLSELLHQYSGKKVYVLIDEYDNAINHAFDKPELLAQLTKFFSNLFGATLKTNDHLERALVTGILRIAKANIFSGINNLLECTILDHKFSEYYGFTESEVTTLLTKIGIANPLELKRWYNGYHIGGHTIYNPWSITQCLANNSKFQAYWSDVGDPSMIRDLWLYKSSVLDKIKLRNLLTTKETTLESVALKRLVSLEDVQSDPDMLWSLLLHTGYLTLNKECATDIVMLPNQEISQLLEEQINNWYRNNQQLTRLAINLLTEDLEGFREALQLIINNEAYSGRIFSGGGRAANDLDVLQIKEFIYQFLIMHELYCINIGEHNKCEVIAEPELISQGRTRPDFVVINHERKLCIVGEIKSMPKDIDEAGLDKAASEIALAQAERNEYGIKYLAQGYKVLRVGLTFRGLRFGMAHSFSAL